MRLTTQQTGIDTAPMRKPHEATITPAPKSDNKSTVRKNMKFSIANPNSEICASRYIRRFKLQ
jgi:hypothetical protein